MADIAIFRINYKSDFILTLQSDAGWLTPFCIKFWTGAPSQAYFAGYDGTTYTHCAPVESDPTKLSVQFDDHHLPIGDLKFQIGYHFTAADFPTSVEDEVINQAAVIIDNDGEQQQVMLDFNGETAPEIAFSLPAYANEAQRIANEAQRVANEAQRVSNEETRIADEQTRQQNEQQRISQEAARVRDFSRLKTESEAATAAAQTAATVANEKAALAQQKADYAHAQGDYAKAQGDAAQADHVRAESDHGIAAADHEQAAEDHTRAEGDHATAASDHETYAETVGENTANIAFINKSFGKYDGERAIILQQAKADKYVNTDGGETTASGYGISAPVALNAGDILLVPSAQAVPATVSVIARLVDRTYQKVVAYIYTYRTDYPELPITATADYDATLVYTAVYDESGDTPTLTGWMRNGETYTTLPATREVSEQFYEPLMKQAVSAMPSTGYYIYLCPTAMTVVVSGLTATVSGGTSLVVGWGIFKNITTNFVGAPGQSVLAQAFAVLFAAIDGLKAQLENLGETKADSIDFGSLPRFCGQPMVIEAAGAPASPNLPTMVGQRYHDTTNKKVYEAFSVTGAISDWVLLN